MTKHILVTGGNSGIGLALCKLLIKDHSCYVYLGSRDAGRGTAAMKSILEEVPDKVFNYLHTYLASIWLGTIHILRQHIFGLFRTHHLLTMSEQIHF